MSMDTQKRAVPILRMAQWDDRATATRRLLTERVTSPGVRPDAIEVREWRGVKRQECSASAYGGRRALAGSPVPP
jgi:hypothetical protein